MIVKSRKDSYGAMTVGEARAFGFCFGLRDAAYNKIHQMDVYYLKLALLMKEAGCVRAAGRCYMEALRWSILNEAKSGMSGEFVCATNPERVYRMVVHFYFDLGSISYLKKVKKIYSKWILDSQSNKLWQDIEREYNHKNELYAKIDEVIEGLGFRV